MIRVSCSLYARLSRSLFLPRAIANFQLVAATRLQRERSQQQQPTFSCAIIIILRRLSHFRVREPVLDADERYREGIFHSSALIVLPSLC